MFSIIHLRSFFSGISLMLITLLLSLSVQSQVRVTRVTGDVNLSGKYGVFYSLPRTVLVVDLVLTRTDEAPGPYAHLSQEMLGIDKVISERKTLYRIEQATISSYTEPDPGQVFMVEMDEKASEAVLMEFARNGLLAGAELIDEKEMETMQWMQGYGETVIDPRELFPFYQEASLKETVDTITRVVTFDTLTYREKILKRLMIQQSDREKASEAAAMIHDIGQDQYTLLVGYQETAYEYEAIKYMYDQLEAQRKNYLQLFTGIIRNEVLRARYFVVPDDEMLESPHTLAGFSSAAGLTATRKDEEIVLRIERSGLTSRIGNFNPSVAASTGFQYRIPETCSVSVEFGEEVLANTSLIINQLGVIRSLSPAVTRVQFDPRTGGVSKILLK